MILIGTRDARKGKQGYFGMKACIGVASKTKIIHSVVATAAKSKVRAKVDQVFGVMKCPFGFSKPRYQGLDKKVHPLFNSVRFN